MGAFLLVLSLLSLSLVRISAAPAAAPSAPVCALQGASSANLVKTHESPNSYQLQFQWTRDVPVDYVDYHFRVNSEDFVNVRVYDGSTPAHEATHSLELSPGDVLHAMLTYSVNGVGCDVAITETTAPAVRRRAPSAIVQAPAPADSSAPAPAPSHATAAAAPPIHLSCDHITQQLVHDNHIGGYDIYATLVPKAQWVDAHYKVSSAREMNVRLVPTTTPNVMALPEPIHAPVGAYISYYLTFGSATAQACDSGHFETGNAPGQTDPLATPAQQTAAPAPDAEPAIPFTQTPITAAPAEEAPAAPAETVAPAAPATGAAGDGAAPAAEPPCAAGNIIHQVASDNEQNYVINFNTAPGDAPFDAVEVYTLVGNDEKTTPMGTNISTGRTPPVHVNTGESLIYYITYSRGGVECKTAFFST